MGQGCLTLFDLFNNVEMSSTDFTVYLVYSIVNIQLVGFWFGWFSFCTGQYKTIKTNN